MCFFFFCICRINRGLSSSQGCFMLCFYSTCYCSNRYYCYHNCSS
nr:MAG TPA: hypothetical protein [Caudoviricetes sp.]